MTVVVEHSHVQFGHTRIPYAIRRSAKRRTVALTIVPDEGVVLTAPDAMPIARLDRLVHDKARWIVRHLREHTNGSQVKPREFISGESFLYMGRQGRLRVLERPEPAPARLDHGRFIVTVASRLRPADRATAVRERLVAWFRKQAEPRLRERARFWARRIGIKEPKVVLAAQQKRWGSCTAHGLVRLNWRIVQAPLSLIDYVVAHELTHLRHHAHSPAFWRALAVVMPEYEARRRALRELGPALEW